MGICHALQPFRLLLLSLFFLPAALGLGVFVNFTNCRVSYPDRRVNVTSVWIDEYPFPLRRVKRIKITAETNYNITEGYYVLNTFSVPLALNPVHEKSRLCTYDQLKSCPVTAGPMVMNFPLLIYAHDPDVFVREYFAEIRMYDGEIIGNQTMCVSFRYMVRDPLTKFF